MVWPCRMSTLVAGHGLRCDAGVHRARHRRLGVVVEVPRRAGRWSTVSLVIGGGNPVLRGRQEPLPSRVVSGLRCSH